LAFIAFEGLFLELCPDDFFFEAFDAVEAVFEPLLVLALFLAEPEPGCFFDVVLLAADLFRADFFAVVFLALDVFLAALLFLAPLLFLALEVFLAVLLFLLDVFGVVFLLAVAFLLLACFFAGDFSFEALVFLLVVFFAFVAIIVSCILNKI